MSDASANPMMRALIVLFGVMAGILAFAILYCRKVAAHVGAEAASNAETSRSEKGRTDETRKGAASSADKTQADEARNERPNTSSHSRRQTPISEGNLKLATTNLHQQAEKLPRPSRKARG